MLAEPENGKQLVCNDALVSVLLLYNCFRRTQALTHFRNTFYELAYHVELQRMLAVCNIDVSRWTASKYQHNIYSFALNSERVQNMILSELRKETRDFKTE